MPKGIYSLNKRGGLFQKGHLRNKGKHWKVSEEGRQKISDRMKGKKLSEETKRKIGLSGKGRIGYMKGKRHSEGTKEKMRKTAKEKGFGKWMIGKKLSEECILKLKAINKGKHTGEKSNWWKGGKWIEPYTSDWTRTFKRSIRERDHYMCQICEKLQDDVVFHIHHMDYDKKNCSPSNLITLCSSCHSKTNHNREYWINYFKNT